MLNISELFDIPKNIEDSMDKDKTEGNQTSKKG
jgi:hypothetical protein